MIATMPNRIVIYVHRYKRPPRKRKALEVPAVVVAKGSSRPPAHEVAPPEAASTNPKPAIVITTNRKRARLLRAERWLSEPREPSRGGGVLRQECAAGWTAVAQ